MRVLARLLDAGIREQVTHTRGSMHTDIKDKGKQDAVMRGVLQSSVVPAGEFTLVMRYRRLCLTPVVGALFVGSPSEPCPTPPQPPPSSKGQ
jgi:hypothetical protein